MKEEIRIVEAQESDAPLIGQVIVTAIGDELAEHLAGDKDVSDVVRMFSILAARIDSQYSYLNALKALDADGAPMGFIVGYDGARLHELRKAFFEEFKNIIGIEISGPISDETGPEQFYLDSLAVFPKYRGRGVATALINAMSKRASALGKPLGLLCDKTNTNARRLYKSLGFHQVGEAPFAGELMDHLQRCI